MSICNGSVSTDFHEAKIHSQGISFSSLLTVSLYGQPCKVKQHGFLLILGGKITGLKLRIASQLFQYSELSCETGFRELSSLQKIKLWGTMTNRTWIQK